MIDSSAAAPAAGIGELSALMAQNQAWLAAYQEERDSFEPEGARQSNTTPPLGIDGPGFFALNDKGSPCYSRVGQFHVAADGRLLDTAEREVLGFSSVDSGGRPSVLRVPESDLAAKRFSRFEIDERGVLLGIERDSASGLARIRSRNGAKVELGRLCIAIFPAPELLAQRDGGIALASKTAGLPRYLPADSAHVGKLHMHPLQPSLDAMRENLRELWAASAHAEIGVAIAASDDALSRIALNLVK